MRLPRAPLILAIAVLLAAALWGVQRKAAGLLRPRVETIVAASLAGLREQNRLSAFAASYVAVVTTTRAQFGLRAQRTLILPGTVQYEVDLAKLRQRDVAWDGATRTLSVTLPPLAVIGPQVDLTRLREYDGGGLLMRLTDAGAALDAANRAAGQADLLRQASAPVPMSLARDATRRAVARGFAMPLRAAGLDAGVRVRFAGEAGWPAPAIAREEMERSRSPGEVLGR